MTQIELGKLNAIVADLMAKEAIRDVLYRYCRAVDRGDSDLMKSCYHPDGRDDHGFFSGRGWDFVDYVLPVLSQLELSIHSLTNPIIEVKGDRAFAETQWSVVHRLKRSGKFTDVLDQGRYLDELECRDGEWRILNRVVVMDAERWIDTVNLLNLVPEDNPHRVYTGYRGKKDPVYRLSLIRDLVRGDYRLSDLWSAYYKLLIIPKRLIHALGKLVQSRATRRD